MRIGQTQAVTAVIITGITLSAVSATYIWGTPILEKRQSQQQLVQTEEEVNNLYNALDSVRNSGEGASERIDLGFSEGTNIYINETGNYIEVTTTAQSSPYAKGTWFLLEGERIQGLSVGEGIYGRKGQDSAGAIALRATGSETVTLQYRAEFRNLYTETSSGPSLETLDIQAQGGQQATGETTAIISNNGMVTDAGTDAVETETGETLPRDRTVATVEFR